MAGCLCPQQALTDFPASDARAADHQLYGAQRKTAPRKWRGGEGARAQKETTTRRLASGRWVKEASSMSPLSAKGTGNSRAAGWAQRGGRRNEPGSLHVPRNGRRRGARKLVRASNEDDQSSRLLDTQWPAAAAPEAAEPASAPSTPRSRSTFLSMRISSSSFWTRASLADV